MSQQIEVPNNPHVKCLQVDYDESERTLTLDIYTANDDVITVWLKPSVEVAHTIFCRRKPNGDLEVVE